MTTEKSEQLGTCLEHGLTPHPWTHDCTHWRPIEPSERLATNKEVLAAFEPVPPDYETNIPKCEQIDMDTAEPVSPSVQPPSHKDADTPEELARWIWVKYVGIPVVGDAYGQEYEHLLDRVRRMDRSTFTKGLHEGVRQIKELQAAEPPSVPGPTDEAGFDEATETRWQDAIYELCKEYYPVVDGGGCDSGDALDLTLSEIEQTIDRVASVPSDDDNSAQAQAAIAHQIFGVLDAPVRILDYFSAVANGDSIPPNPLPFSLDEIKSSVPSVEPTRLVAELKAARTAWHEHNGVPISMEYARFLEAIGKLTDWAETFVPDPPKGDTDGK